MLYESPPESASLRYWLKQAEAKMEGLEKFEGFPKIPRMKRTIIVTEKIDGTNAQIYIEPCDENYMHTDLLNSFFCIGEGGQYFRVWAGSRNRWVMPGRSDNYGFAAWVKENLTELLKLGPGRHFGEWWGLGIQRGYGLDHKRFSLFNTARWNEHNPNRPACCHVVPVLAQHEDIAAIDDAMAYLRGFGSVAAPGFMKPEGVVVYHTASRSMFKVTLENDDQPKSKETTPCLTVQ